MSELPPPSLLELSIRASADEVARASAWLETVCHDHGVPEQQIYRLDVCLNEALANVICYGGAAAQALPVTLKLAVLHDGSASQANLTVWDAGEPFDPVQAQAKPAAQSLDDAVPGGLGLTMMRHYSDRLDYRYSDGHNQLCFGVRWTEDRVSSIPFARLSERRNQARMASGDASNEGERRSGDIHWITLFQGTDETVIRAALADCEVLSLPVGATLLRPGEPNHDVYVLLSGRLAAHLASNMNPDSAIAISPGECIGELSAIDGKSPSALVLAVTPARVLKLSRTVFWERLMTLPRVAANLTVALTERMRRAHEFTLKAQREQLELLHLRKELDMARQLQVSMVPLQRPMFPDRQDIDVCGFMEPASNVGGDLFDAFFVDERHLFFCIGDVSGHGVAAALFMARAIGLLRILAMNTRRPDKVLTRLNDRLCVGNDTNLFLTMFCGFLDVRTGRLQYANAGHCAPLLASQGQARRLTVPRGVLVGAFAGMRYTAMERMLHVGDVLFCYSDGVTEAPDAAHQEFSEERCLASLNRLSPLTLDRLLEGVRADVAAFTGFPTLVDDCTMLALRRPAL